MIRAMRRNERINISVFRKIESSGHQSLDLVLKSPRIIVNDALSCLI